uniref:PI3K/PI4K catalytic domain-containing protein n=1 Tax=Ditylenchus dipsaci TaxID=166011 RepID=A0A915D0N3_9BILA
MYIRRREGSFDTVVFGSGKYYALCGLGGILSCGITHTAIVPLDLVKCRIQVNPEKYKSIGVGFKVTVAEEGARGLAKGWAPTLIGMASGSNGKSETSSDQLVETQESSIGLISNTHRRIIDSESNGEGENPFEQQFLTILNAGMGKFGFYEMFKILYANMLGEENAYTYRTGVYLAASASAEFFADVMLAPMEAAKVRIQTSPACPPTLRGCVSFIYKSEGIAGFYKGLPPLWMRQIPYTMMKFACFEVIYLISPANGVPIHIAFSEKLKPEQLVITFIAGYIAGLFCAIVSHPADTVVSKLNQGGGVTAGGIFKKLGPFGLFLRVWGGLVPRIIMIELEYADLLAEFYCSRRSLPSSKNNLSTKRETESPIQVIDSLVIVCAKSIETILRLESTEVEKKFQLWRISTIMLEKLKICECSTTGSMRETQMIKQFVEGAANSGLSLLYAFVVHWNQRIPDNFVKGTLENFEGNCSPAVEDLLLTISDNVSFFDLLRILQRFGQKLSPSNLMCVVEHLMQRVEDHSLNNSAENISPSQAASLAAHEIMRVLNCLRLHAVDERWFKLSEFLVENAQSKMLAIRFGFLYPLPLRYQQYGDVLTYLFNIADEKCFDAPEIDRFFSQKLSQPFARYLLDPLLPLQISHFPGIFCLPQKMLNFQWNALPNDDMAFAIANDIFSICRVLFSQLIGSFQCSDFYLQDLYDRWFYFVSKTAETEFFFPRIHLLALPSIDSLVDFRTQYPVTWHFLSSCAISLDEDDHALKEVQYSGGSDLYLDLAREYSRIFVETNTMENLSNFLGFSSKLPILNNTIDQDLTSSVFDVIMLRGYWQYIRRSISDQDLCESKLCFLCRLHFFYPWLRAEIEPLISLYPSSEIKRIQEAMLCSLCSRGTLSEFTVQISRILLFRSSSIDPPIVSGALYNCAFKSLVDDCGNALVKRISLDPTADCSAGNAISEVVVDAYELLLFLQRSRCVAAFPRNCKILFVLLVIIGLSGASSEKQCKAVIDELNVSINALESKQTEFNEVENLFLIAIVALAEFWLVSMPHLSILPLVRCLVKAKLYRNAHYFLRYYMDFFFCNLPSRILFHLQTEEDKHFLETVKDEHLREELLELLVQIFIGTNDPVPLTAIPLFAKINTDARIFVAESNHDWGALSGLCGSSFGNEGKMIDAYYYLESLKQSNRHLLDLKRLDQLRDIVILNNYLKVKTSQEQLITNWGQSSLAILSSWEIARNVSQQGKYLPALMNIIIKRSRELRKLHSYQRAKVLIASKESSSSLMAGYFLKRVIHEFDSAAVSIDAAISVDDFDSLNDGSEISLLKIRSYVLLSRISPNDEKAMENLKEACKQSAVFTEKYPSMCSKNFVKYATFAEKRYWELREFSETPAFALKKEAISQWQAEINLSNSKGSNVSKGETCRREREIECEKVDVKAVEDERNTYLRESSKYYLNALVLGSLETGCSDAILIHRFAALLMQNVDDEELSRIMLTGYLPVFGCLSSIFYQVIFFNWSPNCCTGIQVKKKITLALLKKVCEFSPRLKEIIAIAKRAHDVLRDFAKTDHSHFEACSERGKQLYKISERQKILSELSTLQSVPIPVLTQKLTKAGDFDVSSLVSFQYIQNTFELADGLSTPKVIVVTGSDGVKYKLIFKKEDIRQDGLIQQLFLVSNLLMQKSKVLSSLAKSFKPLRQYNVLPLDGQNGIIEWCQGTQSICGYLAGHDKKGGAHLKYRPKEPSVFDLRFELSKLDLSRPCRCREFLAICNKISPVFRYFFYEKFSKLEIFHQKVEAYTRSLAQWSAVCYVVGLGDRHLTNILIDEEGELVHIDLGQVFEYSKRMLKQPEKVDPILLDGIHGKLKRIACETLKTMRENAQVLIGISSLILYDPISSLKSRLSLDKRMDKAQRNLFAECAISRLKEKLAGRDLTYAEMNAEEQWTLWEPGFPNEFPDNQPFPLDSQWETSDNCSLPIGSPLGIYWVLFPTKLPSNFHWVPNGDINATDWKQNFADPVILSHSDALDDVYYKECKKNEKQSQLTDFFHYVLRPAEQDDENGYVSDKSLELDWNDELNARNPEFTPLI